MASEARGVEALEGRGEEGPPQRGLLPGRAEMGALNPMAWVGQLWFSSRGQSRGAGRNGSPGIRRRGRRETHLVDHHPLRRAISPVPIPGNVHRPLERRTVLNGKPDVARRAVSKDLVKQPLGPAVGEVAVERVADRVPVGECAAVRAVGGVVLVDEFVEDWMGQRVSGGGLQ